MLKAVGPTPHALTPWNAYPWFVNRAPSGPELDAGVVTVFHVADLMPELRIVLLQGRDAKKAWTRVLRHRPSIVAERQLTVIETFHPSPQALFVRDVEERQRRDERWLETFQEMAALLPEH